MPDVLEIKPETLAKLTALQEFELTDISWLQPIQARGWFESHYWYFQCRGPTWSFEIGGNPAFSQPPIWWQVEDLARSETGSSSMTTDTAARCILKAIKTFKSKTRVVRKPGDPDYGDHLLNAWSVGLVSATKVGSYLNINVIQVVELGLQKGLPQPWTATHEVQRYISFLSDK
jgi:hypothetical protein